MAKTKLTKKLIETIAEYIEKGATVEATCKIVGIHKSTYYDWLSKAEEGKKGLISDFSDAIKKAEGEAEYKAIASIFESDNWQAKAWYLERKHYDRWGKKDKLVIEKELEKNVDEILDVAERVLSEANYIKLIASLSGDA